MSHVLFLSYRALTKVKIKSIVTYQDLRNMRLRINGIKEFGARTRMHYLRVRALDVYDRLSIYDAADHEKFKDAFLRNFDMTELVFRKKFLYDRPEKSETFVQFTSRLRIYLEKWLYMTTFLVCMSQKG